MSDQGTTIATLRRRLAARDKTIETLSDMVESKLAHSERDLTLTFAMSHLEEKVAVRTAELDRQKRELERTLKELGETQAQLLTAQKLEAVGQLAAGVAHEINTPMQYIGDNAAFLRTAFGELMTFLDEATGELDPRRARKLEFIRSRVPRALDQTIEGVEQVSRLVSAMKEFSHPGSGAKAPLDVNQAIRSTMAISRNEWKYVAAVELDLDPELPEVPALGNELKQALLNILVNAAHAVGEVVADTGGKGLIRVSTRATRSEVRIAIQDSGPGIPEAIRRRIFDPFFTTKGVGVGTGQGLAIARSIVVDKHGGSIEVATGDGTTFTICLPRHAPLSLVPTPAGAK